LRRNVKILAADSMGVRSLATYVEMCGHKIAIDLGASLAPRRYGLPPHQLERNRLKELLNIITKKLKESDIVIISHYHYDHYLRDRPELYASKELFVKDPRNNINRSQRLRAWKFLQRSGLVNRSRIHIADDNTYSIGDLRLEFSPPVWHGEVGTKVGKVVMVRLLCKSTSIIFTSDVQGPADPTALNILKRWSNPRPDLLILCGPPTYFAGFKVSKEAVQKGIEGVRRVIKEVRPSTLVIDHHLVRDINYMKYMSEFKSLGNKYEVEVLTAAEFMGFEPEPLEAWRKHLWSKG
jgi:predicted metallo-beta-lactamase superfamily hydrolase